MAITRDKKNALVDELTTLLSSAKMTTFAAYTGLTVAELQQLRAQAREAGVVIKVVKNRLVRVAASSIDSLKEADLDQVLKGQLIYALSDSDEVAPAQVLDKFAKDHPGLQLTGAISGEGVLLSTDEVKSLASLPSKDQLIAETIAQMLSPVHDITNGLSGNLHALLDGIETKATA